MDDYDDYEIENCDVCGADLSLGYPQEPEGCPCCLPCGGQYAAGTEDCDFCSCSEECEKAYIEHLNRA